MDTSRISLGEVVAAVCAVLLFVFLFVDWFGSFSAWQVFDVVDVVLSLIAVAVVALVAVRAVARDVSLPVNPSRIITWAGVVALILVLAFLFEGEEREIGVFLSLLAAIGICIGGLMAAGELAVVRRPAADAPAGAPPPRDASAAPTVADTDPRPADPSPAEPGDRPPAP